MCVGSEGSLVACPGVARGLLVAHGPCRCNLSLKAAAGVHASLGPCGTLRLVFRSRIFGVSRMTWGPLVSCSRVTLGTSAQYFLALTLTHASSCAVLMGDETCSTAGTSAGSMVEDLLVVLLLSLSARVPFGGLC